MTQRFTIDGSDELESTLEVICERACNDILKVIPRDRLHAIVLGGGYGRGEGGVLRTSGQDLPYNDLEFYILAIGQDVLLQRKYRKVLAHVAEELTDWAGIEVEFKLISVSKLERSPVTMFYYDLVSGHRLIFGEDSWVVRCEHHRAAHRIPLHEATRLLFNRCSGLLYSQEKLQRTKFTEEDSDFVGRNLAKAKLAFGDVMLAMRGQYHWSCQERHKRLRKLDAEGGLLIFDGIIALHAEGVAFKLHPFRSNASAASLSAELRSLKLHGRNLLLALESRRLGKTFNDIAEYGFDSDAKCPETNPLKNRLINLRHFGVAGGLTSTYPRERLLRALPVLLWEPDLTKDPATLAYLQKQLNTTGRSYSELVRAYEELWRAYN